MWERFIRQNCKYSGLVQQGLRGFSAFDWNQFQLSSCRLSSSTSGLKYPVAYPAVIFAVIATNKLTDFVQGCASLKTWTLFSRYFFSPYGSFLAFLFCLYFVHFKTAIACLASNIWAIFMEPLSTKHYLAKKYGRRTRVTGQHVVLRLLSLTGFLLYFARYLHLLDNIFYYTAL